MKEFAALTGSPRLLLEAHLEPLQGRRFQPTGFADLGAATYTLPDGTAMLLVESAQSVANRLESVCWDPTQGDLAAPLQGLPYIRVRSGAKGQDGKVLSNSILEAHRLNSPYILNAQGDFLQRIKGELREFELGPIDLPRAAAVVYKYDPNAILHGVFFAHAEIAGGRVRLQRILSGFIEASGISVAESGGVKNDRVNPSGNTREGFGNVPFHRVEYVAERIVAYFNLDLATLRSYRLGAGAEALLTALALWKIQRFLDAGLRLRTACDLEVKELRVTRPEGFAIPDIGALEAAIGTLLEEETQFADPRVTEVTFLPAAKGAGERKKATDDGDGDGLGASA